MQPATACLRVMGRRLKTALAYSGTTQGPASRDSDQFGPVNGDPARAVVQPRNVNADRLFSRE